MNKTKIEWVKNPDGSQGYTWNPITGCLNGCSYCYARKLANGRLRHKYLANENTIMRFSDGYAPMKLKVTDPFYPRFWESRQGEIMGVRDGKGIFVCDMSDLFGIGVPEEWTEIIMRHISFRPGLRFYLLTKQPQNLIKFSPFPDHCWVGVTACNWKMAFDAFWELQDVKASVKYVSFEPLLDSVGHRELEGWLRRASINWVIIGAQTKPYKPPKIEWVEEIVRACDKAGVPVFLKDNLKLLIQEAGMGKAGWAAREWVQCKYPILRQELPK